MDENTEPTLEELVRALVDSEAFMWLMHGVGDHTDAHIKALRPTYTRYRELGGGWGNNHGTA